MFRTERSKYLSGLGIPLNTDSTLKGQTVFLAERASELIQENIITDRTIIDVIAFTQASKSIDWTDKEAFYAYAMRLIKEYDYIFYVSPEGVEIEDNGVRETDAKYRIKIDDEIQKLLIKYNSKISNLVKISGTTEERIQKIKQTIFS